MNDYQSALRQLYTVNVHSGVKLGLKNSLALCSLLSNPQKQYKTVHVAGTNGKGSVVTKIAKGLELAGHRVGLYTSPHIACFRERITINGKMIDEGDVARLLQKLFKLPLEPTFFEMTTFLAFLYFAEQKVDYAVIETGLGGRQDATNVVSPVLSVITSISLDHTEILGNTEEQVAYEKAGIIKYGVPLVIGPRANQEIILQIARIQRSPVLQVTGQFASFDQENNEIAKRALAFLNVQQINEALKVKPPCRREIFLNGQVMLDVAHNPDGLKELFRTIDRKMRIVFGLSKTKDIPGCLAILKEHGSHFHIVEAPNGRGMPVDELYQQMLEQGFDSNIISRDGDIATTMRKAIESADPVLVCGSFFIMSEARKALGVVEPYDHFDMNEVFKK
jgi:dihydrofolate synthase/folylpolyglutamate synthase